MPVDPTIQGILDAVNARSFDETAGLPPSERRIQMRQATEQIFVELAETPGAVAAVTDHRVPVDGVEITVRVYTPQGVPPFPALVYFHGGAFWLGDVDLSDPPCRDLAHRTGSVVASVDYRLAPENPFPIPVEDCFAALAWTVAQSAELGVDVNRVAIGGSSAGGNLAAAVALMARDRGGPAVCFQWLDIPVTDSRLDTPSMREFAEGYLLTKGAMLEGWAFYVPDLDDRANPYASPMHAADVSGLPPAFVTTAEYDPLRDEGEAYGARLADAGVVTTIQRYDGMIHGFGLFTAILPTARECRDDVVAALRSAFG
ncbi:MAG: alpha/beta hydrolase [Acidimicrobiia bacterium]